jgi:protein-S-isoprenylcysteine O-methyltransferase Ste14
LLASGSLMAAIPLSPIPIPAGCGIGVLLLILGFVTTYSGFSAFRKAGTPVRPGNEPTKLVTSGPYRITRNPMYLGLELVLLGAICPRFASVSAISSLASAAASSDGSSRPMGLFSSRVKHPSPLRSHSTYASTPVTEWR